MKETFFEELKRYVRFGPGDEAALRRFAPRAEPHFASVVERFYERIEEHDEARALIADAAQRGRLEGTLRDWLSLLFQGPWDEAYWERRARIGRVHVAIGLPQRYMFAAMSVVRTELASVVRRSELEPAERPSLESALHKILDLELAIMLESYRETFVEKVQHLERLEKANLERRLASVRNMAAGLAHGILNPLNAAHLQLNLARRRLSRDERDSAADARSAIDTAAAECERLSALVNDFLLFARPQPLRPARTDLVTVVQATAAMLQPEATRANVQLTVQPLQSAVAEVDDEKMQQVLLNLVRNAVDAAGSGGKVRIGLASKGSGAELTVEDDGPGFEPDAPIFEPFYTTKHEGTGLGLSVVHRIVADHGGTVQATSRRGRTVFVVQLPKP